MPNPDLQAELKAKIKEGIKPSQFKRSTSTPAKTTSPSEPKQNLGAFVKDQEAIITKLEQQKADLLKLNQQAIQQNEQLAKLIEQLKQENHQLSQAQQTAQQTINSLEEALIEKRMELLKTPLHPNLLPTKRNEKEKNILIIFLLITLAGALLFK